MLDRILCFQYNGPVLGW